MVVVRVACEDLSPTAYPFTGVLRMTDCKGTSGQDSLEGLHPAGFEKGDFKERKGESDSKNQWIDEANLTSHH